MVWRGGVAMQNNESRQDTTLYGADGREFPDSGAASSQDDADWRDVGRQIERLLRRDVARLVGSEEADDWNKIKDAMVGRVRGQAESVETGEIGKRVEEIGRKVEEQLRCGMTQATGAG